NVRCACVHVSGVVRESMGENLGAGISGGWFGGSGGDGVAGAAGYWIPDQVRDDAVWVGKRCGLYPTGVIPGEDPGSSMLGDAEDRRRSEGAPSPLEGV